METKSAIRAHSAKKFKSKVFKKWINAKLDMKQNHEVKLNSTFFSVKVKSKSTDFSCLHGKRTIRHIVFAKGRKAFKFFQCPHIGGGYSVIRSQ